ncbi:MAG TPA: threonylcarbamoyl-AMP synthase [Anaerolineae bacterium]|nr:threonylcarbamoyl-AMP synthase [Anaerolineae bacterium]
MTEIVMVEAPGAVESAAAVLRSGGLVAFPTDTVYGLAALAMDPAAVLSIYRAKGRPESKAIPLFIASFEELAFVATEVPPAAQLLAQHFWPGPLTLVLRRRHSIPDVVTAGGETVAVRVPDHPVPLAILRLGVAPLAVTSANRSGAPETTTATQVMAQLGNRVDLVLDGGRCPAGIPSTVVDVTVTPPVVLRQGPISQSRIEMALE